MWYLWQNIDPVNRFQYLDGSGRQIWDDSTQIETFGLRADSEPSTYTVKQLVNTLNSELCYTYSSSIEARTVQSKIRVNEPPKRKALECPLPLDDLMITQLMLTEQQIFALRKEETDQCNFINFVNSHPDFSQTGDAGSLSFSWHFKSSDKDLLEIQQLASFRSEFNKMEGK
jgi:hypothetical protein